MDYQLKATKSAEPFHQGFWALSETPNHEKAKEDPESWISLSMGEIY